MAQRTRHTLGARFTAAPGPAARSETSAERTLSRMAAAHRQPLDSPFHTCVGIAIALDPGMPRLAYAALAFSLFLYGCPDGGQPDPDPDPDQEPLPEPDPPPPPAPELAGSYRSLAHWDLSSAITEHPGAGTLVADLIVEQVVELSGVPGPLQDAAREQVAAAIHEPIRDYVDARVPSDVAPDSELLTKLADVFADVEVESDITLLVTGSDGDRIDGAETLIAMRLRHDDRTLRLPVDVLELGDASVPVGALIDGSIDKDTTITFETHEFALRVDLLLTYAATELLEVLDAETLAERVTGALECASIVERITGGSDTFAFEVGGMSFSLGIDALLDGCGLVRDEVAGYAFGLIDPALGVAVGGTASALETSGDASIDRLVSNDDYSGLITAVPLPTPTRFDASFTAQRAAAP